MREKSHLEHSHVKWYSSLNVSWVIWLSGKTGSATRKFSDSLSKEENVHIVSPVYKGKETISLIVIREQINDGFKTCVDKRVIKRYFLNIT
jgi:hypothetical protein